MNPTATISARLAADATLTALLATYGGSPAIFNERAPDAFQIIAGATPTKPCLVIAAATDDRGDDTFIENGRAIVQDVRGYAPDTGSTLALDNAMRRVRDLFHNAESQIPVTGGRCVLSKAQGPVAAPTSDASVIGRRVILRLSLKAN
jgi:hypothetical protein